MKTAEHAVPQSLLEMIARYSDPQVCHDAMVGFRWANGVACPHCGCTDPWFTEARLRWQCKGCKRQFTVKVGTIFEDSPLPLTKWLPAVWLITNAKNGISSCELARALPVTQKTAWFMLHRIREAMKNGSFTKLSGTIEADETFVGGKEKNRHTNKKQGWGLPGSISKTIVMGVLERSDKAQSSQVRATVIPNTTKAVLGAVIRAEVAQFATIYTDAWRGYNGLSADYIHAMVDHAICYAVGKIHSNGIENFWSLLKRTLKGTYVSVEPFHLERYIDEQVFRFNERKGSDAERFVKVLGQVNGKRLTYDELTNSYEGYYERVLPTIQISPMKR